MQLLPVLHFPYFAYAVPIGFAFPYRLFSPSRLSSMVPYTALPSMVASSTVAATASHQPRNSFLR